MTLFLVFLLIAHSIVTTLSLPWNAAGFLSVFPPFRENYAYQIFSDLLSSLLLVQVFIYREERKRGVSPVPFFGLCIGVLLSGSFAPLIYLLARHSLFFGEYRGQAAPVE